MSKIIKAAELMVLLGESEDKVIRSAQSDDISDKAREDRLGPMARASKTLEDADAQSEALIKKAEEEAISIVAAAEKERDTVRLQAKQEGWNEGYEEGQQTGFEEALAGQKEAYERLHAMVREAAKDRAAALNQLEPDFLKLAFIIAEKIIRREISQDPQWLAPLIAEALQRLGAAEAVTIRIHPKDLQPLREAEYSWSDFRGTIHWESDDTLKRGTLICETEFGAIDASLEQRLGTLASGLLEVIYDADE